MMGVRVDEKAGIVEAEQWIKRPIGEVFEFFSDARNLERITPDFLKFKVLSMSTPVIGPGTIITYKLRVRGVPISWKSRIDGWNPPHGFSDTQILGPYKKWLHVHDFYEKDGGTVLWDRVEYKLHLAPLMRLPFMGFVARDIKAIFEYRQKVIQDLFV